MILVLPFVHFSTVKMNTRLSISGLNSYVSHLVALNDYQKMRLLNFLHRICYSLVLSVGLYAVFRQRRPCVCSEINLTSNEGIISSSNDYTFSRVGSIYGMPSGDAMAGGVFGATIIDWCIGSSMTFINGKAIMQRSARIFFGLAVGIILAVAIAFERVILGRHTIAQTTVGITIAILLHIYQTRIAPQFMIFVDAILQLVLCIVAHALDPNLVYKSNDPDNLTAWWMWGFSFQIFVCLLVARFYLTKKSRRLMLFKPWYIVEEQLRKKASINLGSALIRPGELLNSEYETMSEHSGIENNDEVPNLSISSAGDVGYLFVAFSVLLIVNFFSYLIQVFNWFSFR